jgi:succinyl-CoA synthetase beta subunit
MNLHEFQGKEILKSFGVAIQEGIVVNQIENAVESAKKTHRINWYILVCC